MAIDITEFTNASISVSPTGVGLGNFGILGFVTTETDGPDATERARLYSSLTGVTADFATTTETYKAAAAFYGQTPMPKDFLVIYADGTPVAALADAVDKGIDFTAVVTHKSMRDTLGDLTVGNNTTEIADWCEANKKLFFNTTNDSATIGSLATDQTAYDTDPDTASVALNMKNKTLRYTITNYSSSVDEYPSASIFGRAASVNFEGIGTTLTLNLKQMPGISVENLTVAEYNNLKDHYANAVVKIGKSTNAYTDSRMANGSWLDTTHGLMWLENRIEVDMFNLLYQSNTKIPYTQAGINLAASTLSASLNAAVRNGLAGAGYLPDGTYLPDGFVVTTVPIEQVSSSDKSNRIYNGLGFKMVGAGALHEINISGEFSE